MWLLDGRGWLCCRQVSKSCTTFSPRTDANIASGPVFANIEGEEVREKLYGVCSITLSPPI
jgi:hypothetical protein